MQTVNKLLDEFIKKRILIVGEIAYVGSAEPNIQMASAALTSIYAAQLGAKVSLVGTIGADLAGSHIINKLRDKNINFEGIIIDPLKPTLCWDNDGSSANKALNIITETQVTDAALRHAHDTRAIIYMCKNPINFSDKIYKQLKQVSEGLKIPLAVFGNADGNQKIGKKPLDLHIMNDSKKTISKKLCITSNASECIVINKQKEFNILNKNTVKHHRFNNKSELYEMEAILSAISVLLLACQKYPRGLTELANNVSLRADHISFLKQAVVS